MRAARAAKHQHKCVDLPGLIAHVRLCAGATACHALIVGVALVVPALQPRLQLQHAGTDDRCDSYKTDQQQWRHPQTSKPLIFLARWLTLRGSSINKVID